jgi:hypothetical protein
MTITEIKPECRRPHTSQTRTAIRSCPIENAAAPGPIKGLKEVIQEDLRFAEDSGEAERLIRLLQCAFLPTRQRLLDEPSDSHPSSKDSETQCHSAVSSEFDSDSDGACED